jgi:phosphoglycolate phosphatase
VRGFVGEGARVLIARAISPADHLLDPALAAWRVHYEAHCLDRTRLFPGLAALLAGLAERRALAVLTNKPGALARKILDGLGVLPRFAAVVGGDEAPRKPDPTGLLAILARAGAAPADAVLVGDSAVDVATARAAGVAMIAVTWGLVARADLAAAGAPALVDDAAALAAALR